MGKWSLGVVRDVYMPAFSLYRDICSSMQSASSGPLDVEGDCRPMLVGQKQSLPYLFNGHSDSLLTVSRDLRLALSRSDIQSFQIMTIGVMTWGKVVTFPD